MKKIFDPTINKIVRESLPNLIDIEGLVVAGGFASALYSLHMQSPSVKNKLLKSLKYNLKKMLDSKYLKERSSDVDYWVLNNTQAHDLMKKYLPGPDGKIPFVDKKALFGNSKITEGLSGFLNGILVNNLTEPNTDFIFPDAGIKNLSVSKFTGFSIHLNSIKYPKSDLAKHQIIRMKSYDSIDEIVEGYDINLCRVAWYQDHLYISKDAESDFMFETLTFNDKITEYENAFKTVWSALRFFKYYNRYGYEPDESALQQIIDVYMEAIDFLTEHQKEEFQKQSPAVLFGNLFSIHPQQITEDDSYDKTKKRSIKQMSAHYQELLSNVDLLLSFDEFKPYMAGYLVHGGDANFKKKIQEYLDQVSGEENG